MLKSMLALVAVGTLFAGVPMAPAAAAGAVPIGDLTLVDERGSVDPVSDVGRRHDDRHHDGRRHDGRRHDGRHHDGRRHDGRRHDGHRNHHDGHRDRR